MSNWIPLKEVDWDDTIETMHVDTRDFGCNVLGDEINPHKDYKTLLKYGSNIFYTIEEVKEIIERLYVESGGEGSWRMLQLDTFGQNWCLKYIRIYKQNNGKYLVCSADNYALRKHHLAGKVYKDRLHLTKDE